MIGEMSVVPRVAKPFGSSLLESYWPEAEHLSNGLGSAVSFKIPMFGYVADLNELFTLARGWVIAPRAAQSVSKVRVAALRRSALILANAVSMGFKSGEYWGRNKNQAPAP